MTIKDLVKDLSIPGETIWLQRYRYPDDAEEDDFGDLEKKWFNYHQITGVFDRPSEDPGSGRGFEEIAYYKMFCEADFDIPDNDLGEYRIKNEIDYNGAKFTRYFRISEINRNLQYRNKTHHYEIILELAKKW
jgi:hypothetical protein